MLIAPLPPRLDVRMRWADRPGSGTLVSTGEYWPGGENRFVGTEELLYNMDVGLWSCKLFTLWGRCKGLSIIPQMLPLLDRLIRLDDG